MRTILMLLTACILFSSCASSENSAAHSESESLDEIIYMIQVDSLVGKIPDNSPWNYQGLFPMGPDIQLESGDTLLLEVTAVSDTDISLLQAYFVDQVDGSGWKVLSGYHQLIENIEAGEEFSLEKEIRISKSSTGDNIKLALYTEYESADSEIILTFSQLTVTRLAK